MTEPRQKPSRTEPLFVSKNHRTRSGSETFCCSRDTLATSTRPDRSPFLVEEEANTPLDAVPMHEWINDGCVIDLYSVRQQERNDENDKVDGRNCCCKLSFMMGGIDRLDIPVCLFSFNSRRLPYPTSDNSLLRFHRQNFLFSMSSAFASSLNGPRLFRPFEAAPEPPLALFRVAVRGELLALLLPAFALLGSEFAGVGCRRADKLALLPLAAAIAPLE